MTAAYSPHCTNSELGCRIHEYQLGTLSDQDMERFEEHVMECDFCRAQLEEDADFSEMLAARRQEITKMLRESGEDFESLLRTARNSQNQVDRSRSFWRRLREFLEPPWVRYGLLPAAALGMALLFITQTPRTPAPIAKVDTPPILSDSVAPPTVAQDSLPPQADAVIPRVRPDLPALAATNVASWALVTLRGSADSDTSVQRAAWQAYEAGRYELSAKLLNDAVQRDSANFEFWFYLALSNYALQRNHEARRALDIAAELVETDSPLQEHVTWYRANLALRASRKAEADSLLRLLISSHSDYEATAHTLQMKLRE